MSLNAFITNSDNLEEQLSAEEFIKSLKKVESVDDNQKSSNSGGSSASGSSDKMQNAKGDDGKKRLMDKKLSTSDLLCKMRGRFQHRATEPVFHTLATGTPEVSCNTDYIQNGTFSSSEGSHHHDAINGALVSNISKALSVCRKNVPNTIKRCEELGS
ncbi:unnamed protein product [Heligmosomoides polygyrus]|uniref:Phosphoinositide phospholipase C n=1 Tax=Heligmosomoides polygyrus TaxID=6339 RepID=A0A183F4H1_HELPZ|nr:unnamed protein product [Heligmosomoides polygyrus]